MNLRALVIVALISVIFTTRLCSAEEIRMKLDGGVYTLPVKINHVLLLDFVIDSGAAEVNIPADLTLALIRAGSISRNDFLAGRTYSLADGSEVKSPRLFIRNLQVGSLTLKNVTATVGSVGSPLLLGQSFLRRLGPWSQDGTRNLFIFRTPRVNRAQIYPGTGPDAKAVLISFMDAVVRHQDKQALRLTTPTSQIGLLLGMFRFQAYQDILGPFETGSPNRVEYGVVMTADRDKSRGTKDIGKVGFYLQRTDGRWLVSGWTWCPKHIFGGF